MDVEQADPRRAISIAIISENPLACSYMRSLLQRQPLYRVVDEETSSPIEQSRAPGFYIFENPAVSTLVHRLISVRDRFPKALGLAVTKEGPAEVVCDLLFEGFQGVVTYNEVDRDLGSAIQVISGGHLWAPAGALERYTTNKLRLVPKERDHRGLTPREQAVAALLEKRLANKQIAHELRISERTVKFHIGNIFRKLGVHERISVCEAPLVARKGF